MTCSSSVGSNKVREPPIERMSKGLNYFYTYIWDYLTFKMDYKFMAVLEDDLVPSSALGKYFDFGKRILN